MKRLFARSITVLMFALLASPVVAGVGATVFINEIHYDNTGADMNEGVEIAGPALTDLTGWSIVLYNGSTGGMYATISLSGSIPNQQNGFGTLNFAAAPSGIQNGSPDGLALVNPSNAVIQFLSYEGSFAATDGPANTLLSTDIGVSETGLEVIGNSLQLQGTGTRYDDFTWSSAIPASAGAVNAGQTFFAPTPIVTGMVRSSPSPTNAATVAFTVTFSTAVTGVDVSDFHLLTNGISGATVVSVMDFGNGAQYMVTTSTGSGAGVLQLELIDDDSITASAGGMPLGGPGTGNGNFAGETFTIDHIPPTVSSVTRASANPTAGPTVDYTVTFSETVNGVDLMDFVVSSAGVNGASVATVTTADNITYTVTVNVGSGLGTLRLDVVDNDTIVDLVGNPLGGAGQNNGNFNTGESYTVDTSTTTPLVVISQVYGGGGNTGAFFKNDFIELFNRGTVAVDVTGWSVQYTSATGTNWQATNLSGTIQPGRYYLVREATGGGGVIDLPAPDIIGGIQMSAVAGKVALYNITNLLLVSCPMGSFVVDFVGYGSIANCSEGSPAPAPSNTTALLRASDGCQDTNSNAVDFTAGAPNPRNSATASNLCVPAPDGDRIGDAFVDRRRSDGALHRGDERRNESREHELHRLREPVVDRWIGHPVVLRRRLER